MRRRSFLISTVGACAGGAGTLARIVEAQGGKTEYVVSVTTNNMIIPGLEDLAKLGGQLPPQLAGMFGAQRLLQLNLRTPGAAPQGATAKHEIPDGLKLGKDLPLEITRPTAGAAGGGSAPDKLPDFSMKIYWGCGDDIKQGQPKVMDAKSIEASMRDALRQGQQAMTMRPGKGRPAAARVGDAEATIAYWPNASGRPTVIAKEASLVGAHALRSSYAGNAEFAIDKPLDFMEAVSFTSPKSGDAPDFGKPTKLAWNRIAGATGYGLMAMSSPDTGKTLIMWWSSSSSVYSEGGVPVDFTPPDRVASLIGSGIVLPPDTNACTIPRNAFKGCDAVMVQLVAYGPVRTFAQPQQTPVRVQVKSTGMLMLGGPGG